MNFLTSRNSIEYSSVRGNCTVTPHEASNQFEIQLRTGGSYYPLYYYQGDGSKHIVSTEYRFQYSPRDILTTLEKHRYFLSWYNPEQAMAYGGLQPPKTQGHWDDRLDHKPKSTIKGLIAGTRTYDGNPLRASDLHSYPNYPFQLKDWERWAKEGSRRGKNGQPIIKNKYVESVYILNSRYDPELKAVVNTRGSYGDFKEAAGQAKRFKDEYVTIRDPLSGAEGNILGYEQKHYYCVIDIDGTDIEPDTMERRARELGAVAYANTSWGCYHILFKCIRVNEEGVKATHTFQNPCVRALLAYHLLGYSPRELFPYTNLLKRSEKETSIPNDVLKFLCEEGIDRNYLKIDCNDMLFRVIGSWNYKKSWRVQGTYFDNPKCYDDASFNALLNSLPDVPLVASLNASLKHQDLPSIKERSNIDPDYNRFFDALSPLFRDKEYQDKWALKLWEDRSFLSEDEPQHGLGLESLAALLGRSYQQVQVTLHKLVNKGYIITNNEWQHPMARSPHRAGEGRTKRYAFGEKLAAFKLEKTQTILNDIPYQRHKSRDGIIRDTKRLRKLGYDVDNIIRIVDDKYRHYTIECKPPEIRSKKEVISLIKAVY